MIDFEKGMYVRIQELAKGPHPRPLSHGFSAFTAYRVLGLGKVTETGDVWLVLSNDRDELWHVSQRHVRTFSIEPERRELRIGMLDSSYDKAFTGMSSAFAAV